MQFNKIEKHLIEDSAVNHLDKHENCHHCTCNNAACSSGAEFKESGIDRTLASQASEKRAVFRIANMDCPMEEALIRKKLSALPGVISLQFNLMRRVLTVEHEPDDLPAIVAALDSIDMHPEELNYNHSAGEIDPISRLPWRRLVLAGILAFLSEICELAGEWSVDLGKISLAGFPLMEILALLLALTAICLGGIATFRKGWLAISNLNLNINALMACAVTGAVLIGQFPEAAMVMVLFNVSEALEAMALDKARQNIKKLMDLAPDMATVLVDGQWQEMPVEKVSPGMHARVRPGEKIGLDGIIISGHSEVNQAPITGESMPVEKAPGDQVFGGTINGTGSFEFKVSAAANDTTLARIIHTVEEAQASRAPMQRFVDIFAKYYTPCVFILALLWSIVPPLLFGAEWRNSIYTGLVLLVIGCPCALVISTPVTIVGGLAQAARKGILIKGGLYLEQGRHMNWLALDKTGTITRGEPAFTGMFALESMPDKESWRIAASLAARSDHPASRAISRAAEQKGIQLFDVANFMALPGMGISGAIDGKEWRLGNAKLMEGSGNESAKSKMQELENGGATVMALMGPEGVAALFAVADEVKKTSIEAVRELESLQVKTLMLTGDNQRAARAIAQEVGVNEFRANLLPGEKLEIIASLEKGKNVVGMAGDGINDAPALARANIGFAMAKGGTDTAIEVADVAIMDDDLRKIPRFIRLSRAVYRILMENIGMALGIKALFFALTLSGHATMWMAVFADVGAALLVIANGLRIMRN